MTGSSRSFSAARASASPTSPGASTEPAKAITASRPPDVRISRTASTRLAATAASRMSLSSVRREIPSSAGTHRPNSHPCTSANDSGRRGPMSDSNGSSSLAGSAHSVSSNSRWRATISRITGQIARRVGSSALRATSPRASMSSARVLCPISPHRSTSWAQPPSMLEASAIRAVPALSSASKHSALVTGTRLIPPIAIARSGTG